jgi:NAD+ kinase
MSRVLIVAHHQRAEAAALAREASNWLTAHGHYVWMLPDDASALDMTDVASDEVASTADLVVSLGGDGTMLRSVQLLGGAAVPIVGVNVGLLGYLTEVEPPAMLPATPRAIVGSQPAGTRPGTKARAMPPAIAPKTAQVRSEKIVTNHLPK